VVGKISISITDEHASVVQEAVRSGAYALSSEATRRIRQQAFQLRILVLGLLQPLGVRQVHPALSL
jgi:hypothetical protein